MTPAEIQQLIDQIVQDLNTAADFAGTLDPALIPFIIIGKAVDKQLPGIALSVSNWVAGNPPTDQEKAEFVRELTALGDPNAP